MLRQFNPSLQSEQFLKDLIVTNHTLLTFIESVNPHPSLLNIFHSHIKQLVSSVINLNLYITNGCCGFRATFGVYLIFHIKNFLITNFYFLSNDYFPLSQLIHVLHFKNMLLIKISNDFYIIFIIWSYLKET